MPDDTPTRADTGVTRRRFLGIATTAAAAAATTPVATLGADTPVAAAGEYDVIVIGGGFCGVTAARECRKAGYRVLLLEARNRLGGRTFTADFSGMRVDLGGSWVHWSQPYVWSEIRRFGLPLKETLGATADKMIIHTSKHDIVTLSYKKVEADVEKAAAAYMGDSRAILPLPHDPFGSDAYKELDHISSWERLSSVKGISSIYRDLIDGFMANAGHNYSDKFSWIEMVRQYAIPGHNLADNTDATERFLFRDGTVSLLECLMQEAKPELRLGTPVRKVIQEDSHVTVVTTGGEELRARAVVSTVPLNVLKDIDWQPALSAGKLAASKETHAGFGTKLHVLLQGDYGNVNCFAPSHNAINWMCTDGNGNGQTHLIGFGPDPQLLDVNDTESVERAVRLFLPDAKVSQSFGYEWTLDPYSQGTWCTLRPGMWSKYLRELQQPRGRLIFASADWANGWRGFIDGAIEQGLEAGRQIKALLA